MFEIFKVRLVIRTILNSKIDCKMKRNFGLAERVVDEFLMICAPMFFPFG